MNKRLDWFPDWRGKAVALIASGPSTKAANLNALRGRLPVLAIKKNIELCPWADVVYGCDAPWWHSVRGLPEYRGIKISQAQALVSKFADIKIAKVEPKSNDILVDEPMTIGAGGNSGFQAVNLAVQFGASRILLVGYDMGDRGGIHWYGRNNWMNANNPNENNFRRWRAAFENAAVFLRGAGVDVVNVSNATTLRCFRKQSLEQTIAEWDLCEQST